MSPLKLVVAAATGVFALASSSSAQTFAFTAVVDSIDSSSSAYAETYIGLAAGDSFSGVLVLDPATPDDLASNPSIGRYFNGVNSMGLQPYYHSSLSLSFPAGEVLSGWGRPVSGQAVETNETVVTNDTTYTFGVSTSRPSNYQVGTVEGDSLIVSTYDWRGYVSGTGGAATYENIALVLNDSGGNIFGSDALPSSLDLSGFDRMNLYYYRGGPTSGNFASFTAHLTCLNAIPEPSILGLCLLSGGMLAFSRRRSV